MSASARTLRVCTYAGLRPHERPLSARMLDCVRADAPCLRGRSSRLCGRECLPPGNFITDAIVRPSHGRLSGHRPTVHPSVHPLSSL
jgi:hypothetical protein